MVSDPGYLQFYRACGGGRYRAGITIEGCETGIQGRTVVAEDDIEWASCLKDAKPGSRVGPL